MLPTAPGADPLHGAHFFVDGPAHGAAAGAIARLLGLDPHGFADDYSWARFRRSLDSGRLHRRIEGHPILAYVVHQYEKIADQEETQNVSEYAMGGGVGAIYAQVRKVICNNMMADHARATVPVLTTFFAYPFGAFCPTAQALTSWWPTFKRMIDEMASAIGRARAVILEEIDAIGTSHCLTGAALTSWLAQLQYETAAFAKLPHAVSYLEAGYSDGNGPLTTARLLVRAGIERVRGFFTNDTHFVWSSTEIGWANRVARDVRRITHGYVSHYIVNTAQNGRGPKRNPYPATQGIEDLCNPPGRGIGRKPTAATRPTFDGRSVRLLDAFLWTGVPGRSHNSNCHPGDAPAGVFDPRFALELAGNANQQLGPRSPGLPY
jgi:glycosyl hydrolase family 6